MKAFGVRLAAGAVTILAGFMMASQSQKDLQKEADSAWTEDAIPPGKAPSPVSRTADLVSTDAWAAEELTPFAEDNPFHGEPAAAADPGVTLVGHTEGQPEESPKPTPMLLPLDEPSADAASADASADSPSLPVTELPSEMQMPGTFADEQADDPSAASPPAAPSISMGMPQVEATPQAAPELPQMSPIRFAETDQAQSPAAATPSNALRSSPDANLREESYSDNALPLPDYNAAASAGPASAPTPQPNSDDLLIGSPSALLTQLPLPEDDQATDQTPNYDPTATMSIDQNESQSSLQIRSGPSGTQLEGSIQESMVGDFPAGEQATGNGYNQPVGGIGDGGYAQAAGGFGVPANYAAQPGPPREDFTAPPMQNAPNLRDPAAGNPSLGNPPYANQSFANPGYGNPPARVASLPRGNEPIYQNAGYKNRGTDAPLPAGPTLASPGDRSLDGPQSPSVVIHKRAPVEVKVGKQATFVITVKNIGGATAMDVRVQDRVPTGMRLDDAVPRPDPQYQGELVWTLGDLEPQQERTITLQLTPLQEGELGSVARVTFQAAASVRTVSTRPELKIVQRAPKEVGIGQLLEIELEVSNPGTGEATGVVLQEDVPPGLEHPQGKQLDNLIGTLGPGETRRQVLRMKAVQPGMVQNMIRVKGDDGLESSHTVAVEIIAPQLQVALAGPSRRYLERQATYELQIANTGTDEATNVEISVQLDRGFTFVSTDFEGQYDSSRHAVFWSLPTLPVGGRGTVPLVLLPVEEGNRIIRTAASADLGVKATSESQVAVDSLAELTFSVNDSADPVEIGGETTYEIVVRNSGSRDDTNVRVHLQFPPGMQLAGNGDFQTDNNGLVAFTPRPLLKANDEVVYRVKARGAAEGRHLVKAIVTSDQSNVPVTKEESIMVYSDQ